MFHECRQFRNREMCVCGRGLQFIFITLTRSTVFPHHLSAEVVTMATRGVVVVAAFRDTGLKHPVVSRGTAEAAALGVTEAAVGDAGASATIGLHSAFAWWMGENTKLN